QTSNWMSESGVGRIDPDTRQNAGRPLMGRPPEGVNDPAGRDSATIFVLASVSEPRLSQVAADAGRTQHMSKMYRLKDIRCQVYVRPVPAAKPRKISLAGRAGPPSRRHPAALSVG